MSGNCGNFGLKGFHCELGNVMKTTKQDQTYQKILKECWAIIWHVKRCIGKDLAGEKIK